MGKAFWLGVIGLIFGILGGVFAGIIGSLDASFSGTGSSGLFASAAGALIFSVVGMTGAALETRKWLGGGLMAIGAFGVLISISWLGVLTFILFLIGAVLIFAAKKQQVATQRVEPEMTGYVGGQ